MYFGSTRSVSGLLGLQQSEALASSVDRALLREMELGSGGIGRNYERARQVNISEGSGDLKR